MIVQVDSREQKNKEVIETLEMLKIPYFVSKLYAGDYMDFKRPKVVIDLKKDLLELAGNLTKQHERFRREIDRADCLGVKFIVLIREPITIEDVPKWKNKRSSIKGETLYKIMRTMSEKYGVIWKFCDRADSGFMVVKLLQE